MKSEETPLGGNEYLSLLNKLGLKPDQKVIAAWGFPDPDVLQDLIKQHKDLKIIDLDINYSAYQSQLLPENYCQIITNIVDNAIALKNNIEIILASTGEEKCDQGRFTAFILEKEGFNVVKTKIVANQLSQKEPIISRSSLPLKEKVILIMDSIFDPNVSQGKCIEESQPTHGFWGVPPNDINLLQLFPDTTHVYGWTRAVEMNDPSNLELEMYVDENIPTVFFSQTFCAKMQLAKYLAKKYSGLYVDVDDFMSVSVKAKIEAFLSLS